MLITLCYVYMWVRFQKCYSALIRNHLRRRSSSFSFCSCSCSSSEENVFLQLGDRAVCVTQPQACDDLSRWTVLLGSSLNSCGPRIENISFIIEATGHKADFHSPRTLAKKVLKWSDYCLPLACSPNQPYRAVAQATLDDFSRLGVAFMEDRLQLDNGLVPSKIVPVLLQESALRELLEKRRAEGLKTVTSVASSAPAGITFVEPCLCHVQSAQQHLQCRKGSLLVTTKTSLRLVERRGSEPLCGNQVLQPLAELADRSAGSQNHTEAHGHHLHLSSCNECLQLENSTILSVKYASIENIADLPDDNSIGLCSEDETLDELEHDNKGFLGQCRGFDRNGKPPNILVYSGGCQERFQAVKQLLLECVSVERYVVYPLQPQQALNDPWLDNTSLLVLAEEHALTPQLQARFLTYLSHGGKVLGLVSTLCPAGLCLEDRERRSQQISRLSFTKEDTTELELSVLASGKVFLRDPEGGGEVELWGELKGDVFHQEKDMVIVRVTHGDDCGEAVLCQVHLDVAPNAQNLTSEGYNELKVSNALRYEVLTEILTSLGLSCELNQPLVASTVHLLATCQEKKSCFLKWLQTRTDPEGLLKLSKMALKMVSSQELQVGPLLPDGELTLVTDSEEPPHWDHFSMETYSKNLKTSLLGHIVLYAEIITSTMDLLEGLTLHLPKDMSLIAIATQQSQGRGRGRNAWLSPPGCAMFTLSVRVELSSQLGQRIPFLQHLAALAVVEAVCSLPGYQDIDLRLKWPNDIYYGNLMKLGGVLLTSTLTGSTLHVLIGCGVNVSNSNPTVCINDLIQQYNIQHGCSLQPLSSALLIARAVSTLDSLIATFQQCGANAILPKYYKRWLHSGTKVHLWSEDGPEAEVVGLDCNGFLKVRSKEHGVVSVEPDGNSFDMLKNLVVTKQH
ncbi:biotin--protein ligase [Thalassophryne amazonica]|uniref:biotin--protein ligase n=1 Tax=Thalassophryne amazonica TaxID=390379 RepID=UPI001471C0FD|nr:biotin--protein ligase [Thalassophryne amazonica]